MKDEKTLFLQKCCEEDREKLLGKRKMTYEDFERFLYLVSYYDFAKYEMEIYRTFAHKFKERDEALLRLWETEGWVDEVEEEIEVEIEKREQWLKEFESGKNK